jgi:heme exporter protein CcmD
MDPHTVFVLAAYLAAALILCGLVAWVVIDRRALERALAELEARGFARRSGGDA